MKLLFKSNVEGDIECKNLIIGKTGTIKGKIIAETIFVEGSIEGEIIV